MTTIKNFFGITKNFTAEPNDICACLAILNVTFIILGFWWAPIVGLINCTVGIILNIKNRVHINLYLMQFAFVILNIYFLLG